MVGRPRLSAEAKLHQLEIDVINGGAIPDNFQVLHDKNFVFDSGAMALYSGRTRGVTNFRSKLACLLLQVLGIVSIHLKQGIFRSRSWTRK